MYSGEKALIAEVVCTLRGKTIAENLVYKIIF